MSHVFGDLYELQERLEYHIINIKKGYSGKCQAVCDIEAAIENGNTDLRYDAFKFWSYEINADFSPAITFQKINENRAQVFEDGDLLDAGDYAAVSLNPSYRFSNIFNITVGARTTVNTIDGYYVNLKNNVKSLVRHQANDGNLTDVNNNCVIFNHDTTNVMAITGINNNLVGALVIGTTTEYRFPFFYLQDVAGRYLVGIKGGTVKPNYFLKRAVGDDNNTLMPAYHDAPAMNQYQIMPYTLNKCFMLPKFTAIAHLKKHYLFNYTYAGNNRQILCELDVYKDDVMSYSEKTVKKYFTLLHVKLLLKTAAIKPALKNRIYSMLDKVFVNLGDFICYADSAHDNMSIYKLTDYYVSKNQTFDLTEFFQRSNLAKRCHSRLTASLMRCLVERGIVAGFTFKSSISTKNNKYIMNTHEMNYNSVGLSCELLLEKVKKTYAGSNAWSFANFTTKKYLEKSLINRLNSIYAYKNNGDVTPSEIYFLSPVNSDIVITKEETPLKPDIFLALGITDSPWFDLLKSYGAKTNLIFTAAKYEYEKLLFANKFKLLEAVEKIVMGLGGVKHSGVFKDAMGSYLADLSTVHYDVFADTIEGDGTKFTLVKPTKPKRNTAHYVRIYYSGCIFYLNVWFLIKHTDLPLKLAPKRIATFVDR